MEVMSVVHSDDGCPAAAAEALHGAERDAAVLGRPADADAELTLERLQYLLRAGDGARDVRADLDRVPAHGLGVEHVVEGRDREAVRGGEIESIRDLAQ